MLGLLSQFFDNFNEYVGVEGGVVSLGFPERSPLPVGHLLNLADAFVEDFQGDLGQSSLLLDQVDLAVEGLRVDEVLDVLDELEVRVLDRELVDVRVEAKAYYD